MVWNYRIIRIPQKRLTKKSARFAFGIYEVYYDGKGLPYLWSKNPSHPFGETWNELYKDYAIMLNAFKENILEEKNGKLKEIK